MGGIPFPKKIRLPHSAYANRENCFHVVFHAAPQTRPFRGPFADAVWALVLDETRLPRIHLVAACLMPDHLHALVSPRELDVIRWASAFKSYSTHVAHETGHKGAIWQPGFYDRRIRDEREFEGAIFYIRQNAARERLVEREEEWAWLYVREAGD